LCEVLKKSKTSPPPLLLLHTKFRRFFPSKIDGWKVYGYNIGNPTINDDSKTLCGIEKVVGAPKNFF